MSKCVYCKQEIKDGELKFESIIYPGKWVCKKCVCREDYLWLKSTERRNFPDFTDELLIENVLSMDDENEQKVL